MGANDATLTEALGHLDTTWLAVRDSVLNDRHLIWIGSGISRERFPALDALLERLFTVLHAAQDPANPDCAYFKAAEHVVTSFSFVPLKDAAHPAGLDLRQSPGLWLADQKKALFWQLTSRYAEVLGTTVNVPGMPRNIPFDILRLEETYSDIAVTPDAEHRFLALLVAEGAVTQIVTTNWDPLTERAHHALGAAPHLWVIACNSELDGAGGAAIVFKVHGCAERTKADPAKYKTHMVATHQDILEWTAKPQFESFYERLRTLLRERPSLFVGISGQDFNLQLQFVKTHSGGPAIAFPPVRVTFSGDSVGVPQRDVLKAAHGENYAANGPAIDTAAALPLYGKPLFGALYISLLFEKLRVILDEGEAQFASDEQRTLAQNGITGLRDRLCARFDVLPVADRWRALADEVPAFISRLLEMYRWQRLPATPEAYRQIYRLNPEGMAGDPNLASLNFHWLCLTLAAVSETATGPWTLRAPVDANGADGQIRIDAPGETALFFANQSVSALTQLEDTGAVVAGSGRKVLIVYPAGPQPATLRRNPARMLPGGRSPVSPREMWFQDCALDYLNATDLIDLLKQEISAAHTI